MNRKEYEYVTVYKIYFDDSDQVYIGATSRDLDRRLYEHMWEQTNKKFKEFIDSDITLKDRAHIIALEENVPIENKLEKERYWIDQYNSIDKGLNVIYSNAEGWHPDEEARKKISENQMGEKNHWFGKFGEEHNRYGQKMPESFIQMMSERMSGEGNPMFGIESPFKGKKHTEETKKAMSERIKGENNPNFGKKRSDEAKAKEKETKRLKRLENPDYGKRKKNV